MSEITQAEALRLFHYDPGTGIVTRRVTTSPTGMAGQIAGTKYSLGYIYVTINSSRYCLHRLIWMMCHGYWPEETDHINGKRDDNRLVNLRDVTSLENKRNAKISKNNSSGICGVCWHKSNRKWRAHISNGKRMHLGYFTSKKDAIIARKMAEYELGYHKNHGRAA